jgi:RNA polymerase sigma-70 factor (ECF subfamily)
VSEDEDRADVDRVLGGDVSAFEAIVRRWQGPLVNLAYRFCRDRGRAEDMAQEAFLRTYRSLSRWRREAAFATWLIALATNLYCSELRRIPARTVPLDEILEPRSAPAVDAELDQARQDSIVRRAVSHLPAKYREVLVLFYFREMEVLATADALGLPEGTVKARLARGREMLRRKLSRVLAPGPGKKEAW